VDAKRFDDGVRVTTGKTLEKDAAIIANANAKGGMLVIVSRTKRDPTLTILLRAGKPRYEFGNVQKGSPFGGCGQPLAIQPTISSLRHLVERPIRTGGGSRPALAKRQIVALESPSSLASWEAESSKLSF